jgi:hypothetical protein
MIDISKTGAITDWAGLAGKTIVAVEDVPRGRYAHTVDAVLIETACFRRQCCAPLSGYRGPWHIAPRPGR